MSAKIASEQVAGRQIANGRTAGDAQTPPCSSVFLNMEGPLLKACGMTREEDIRAINEAEPFFCGFIIDYPKSHRNVSLERAEELAMLLDGPIPVGVFVNEPLDIVVDMVRRGVITTIQLHGSEDDAYVAALREQARPRAIIKAFKVESIDDVERACASSADMVLLDSGKGSGETFDWMLCQSATRPFILAGGLSPSNVEEAIRQTHPWAVDMSTGLETDGVKDAEKIMQAANIVKEQRR